MNLHRTRTYSPTVRGNLKPAAQKFAVDSGQADRGKVPPLLSLLSRNNALSLLEPNNVNSSAEDEGFPLSVQHNLAGCSGRGCWPYGPLLFASLHCPPHL